MSNSEERVSRILSKIRELAERGERGEAENAREMIDSLMKKYNISPCDLEDPGYHEIYLSYSDRYEEVLSKQVLFKVLKGTDRQPYHYKSRRHKRCYAEVTYEEEVEIRYLYGIYREMLYEDLLAMTRAFVIKNKILSGSGSSEDDEELDRESLNRIAKMFDAASFVTINKAIEERSRS